MSKSKKPTKLVQTLLQASVLDRMEHNSGLIVDTKGILSIFFQLESPRIQSRVKSLLMEQLYGDIGCFRYKTTPRIHVRWLVEPSRRNSKSKTTLFVPSRAATRISKCHVIVIQSFCRRGSGQRFACKFHCAIVCKALQWSTTRVDRSINAGRRKRENQVETEVN